MTSGDSSITASLGGSGAALTRAARAAHADPRLPGARADFATFLSASGARRGLSAEGAAREAAEEFVALTLVEPIFASLRESEGAAAPFAPGDAERSFRPLFDAEIARRMVKKSDFAVVDAVARRLLESGRAGGAPGTIKSSPEIERHA